MKKGKWVLCLMLLFVIFCVGCELSEEEKQKRENYYAQASKNAINYINDKYGFNAEFISAECQDYGKWGNDCSEMIIVDMKYNDKTFQVYISGVEETKDGKDNYQHDEIAADIAYEIQKVTGVVPYNYVIDFRAFGNENFINDYYDKKNLKDIVNKWGISVLFEYVDNNDYKNNINLQNIDLFNGESINMHDFYFVNYFSKTSYNNAPSYAHLGGYNYGRLAFYIESFVSITNGELQYYNLDLIKKDDIYFYIDEKNSNSDVYISNTLLDDFDNWNYDEKLKQVSKAYAVNSCNDIYVYIPANKYNKYKTDNLMIAYQYASSNGNKYYTKEIFTKSNYDQKNDYYVDTIAFYDCSGEVKLAVVEK